MSDDAIDVPELPPDEARALVVNGAFLLDVREPEEWQAGRAPEAHHIPLGDLKARLNEVPQHCQVVVICRSGGRSALAAAGLIGHGYDALNLAGGMQAWQQAGLPVIGDDGRPGIVA